MSEMVERLAKTLLRAHYERGRGIPPEWDSLDRYQREMWEQSAKAAIQSMREPTETMINAAMDADGTNMPLAIGYDVAWRAMIDEALK